MWKSNFFNFIYGSIFKCNQSKYSNYSIGDLNCLVNWKVIMLKNEDYFPDFIWKFYTAKNAVTSKVIFQFLLKIYLYVFRIFTLG